LSSFELEYRKKLSKIREEQSKRELDVRSLLANIEKVKIEALKKTEEMRHSIRRDVEKIIEEMANASNLDSETKTKLESETTMLKNELENRYGELRKTILEKAIGS
jgi:hypothetical protein